MLLANGVKKEVLAEDLALLPFLTRTCKGALRLNGRRPQKRVLNGLNGKGANKFLILLYV